MIKRNIIYLLDWLLSKLRPEVEIIRINVPEGCIFTPTAISVSGPGSIVLSCQLGTNIEPANIAWTEYGKYQMGINNAKPR